ALEVLKAHPYAWDRADLAFLRAILCEELRQYQAAALFYATALKFRPDDPQIAFTSAALPLYLPSLGRLDEAWEYVGYQLQYLPNATTFITASVTCFRRSGTVPEGESQR